MAAGPQLLDVTTGQPSNTSRAYPAFEIQTLQTGPQTVNTQGTTSGQTTSRQSQVSTTDMMNTTPTALAALNNLITTLTERPAVSDADLDKKLPLSTPVYTPGGWQWLDPVSGRYMGQGEAQQLNAYRRAERAKLQQEGGMLPAGTQEQQRQQAERQTEITRDREQQAKYSKEAAGADAQALINKAIADALRQAEPGITLASEGAGASKSTFRALALQEAATRGGVEGAALGANLNVAYGQIYNQLGGLLEQLTRADPNGPTAMLLQAINASRGLVQSGTTSSSTSGSQNTQQQTQQQQQQGPQERVGTVQRDQATPGGMPLAMPMEPTLTNPQGTNPYYAFSMGTPATAPVGQTGGTFNVESNTFDATQAYADIVDEGY